MYEICGFACIYIYMYTCCMSRLIILGRLWKTRFLGVALKCTENTVVGSHTCFFTTTKIFYISWCKYCNLGFGSVGMSWLTRNPSTHNTILEKTFDDLSIPSETLKKPIPKPPTGPFPARAAGDECHDPGQGAEADRGSKESYMVS